MLYIGFAHSLTSVGSSVTPHATEASILVTTFFGTQFNLLYWNCRAILHCIRRKIFCSHIRCESVDSVVVWCMAESVTCKVCMLSSHEFVWFFSFFRSKIHKFLNDWYNRFKLKRIDSWTCNRTIISRKLRKVRQVKFETTAVHVVQSVYSHSGALCVTMWKLQVGEINIIPSVRKEK